MASEREGYRGPVRMLRALGNGVIGVITGRRSKWLVLTAGIVVVGIVGPLAGKLVPLEDNSATSFLPKGAPSALVLQYQQDHAPASSTTPAIVVFARPGGLDLGDLATVERAKATIGAAHLRAADPPGPVSVSADHRAATFSVPIASSAPQQVVVDDVKAIRAVAERDAVSSTAHPGPHVLQVAVGGPAGSAADAVNAFAGIDGKLLVITVLIVTLLLLLIYRSPVLWLLPLLSVSLAAGWAQGFAYLLARNGFVVNGMTVGILTVLVFGAGTDYALLLVARYREELHHFPDHHEAMAHALRRAGPAIATSGGTVILALLCLLVAQLTDIAALGPACAAGILCALVAQLAFLPALLLAIGRRAFWPKIPRWPAKGPSGSQFWGALGRRLSRHPRPVWIGLAVALAACCFGLFAYRGGVDQQNGFRVPVQSVQAQQLLTAYFPGVSGAPAVVLVRPASATVTAVAAARSTPGVATISGPTPIGQATTFDVALRAPPTSAAATATVTTLRQRLARAVGPATLVGGETATNLDLQAAAVHDRNLLIPIILAVVVVMLGLLLRSLVASVLLASTVLLSYLASLGVSAVVFRYLFSFPGFDPSVPILGFVFLVALGVDYNIFLMARVREEAVHGAVRGVVRGLAVTGAVITSAGIVLAATFAVLGVLPLIALTEVGFLVAFGVLVDTVVVRSILVPALAMDIGPPLWWPSALVQRSRATPPAGSPTATP